MRVIIPLTGTVLVEGSVHGAGGLVGDDKDPIRPVDIDLGDVSWTMVDVDLENAVMVIEVTPAKNIYEDTGEVDGENNPIYKSRPATDEEKTKFLQDAQKLIETHTKDELYQMSKCAKLKRPFKEKK